mmetsp:Transcript_66748/g.118089  ORF Transcript_66748/g.118089 Transcript_66748/m.118089 type:complete len:267 (-) Transcript_66748:2313-3113(-)
MSTRTDGAITTLGCWSFCISRARCRLQRAHCEGTLHQTIEMLVLVGCALRGSSMRPGHPKLLCFLGLLGLAGGPWRARRRPSRRHGLLRLCHPAAGCSWPSLRTRRGFACKRLRRSCLEELSCTQLSLQLGNALLGAFQLLSQGLILLFDGHEMLDLLLWIRMATQLCAALRHSQHIALVSGFTLRQTPGLSERNLEILLLHLEAQKYLAVLLFQLLVLLVQTLHFQLLTHHPFCVYSTGLGLRPLSSLADLGKEILLRRCMRNPR